MDSKRAAARRTKAIEEQAEAIQEINLRLDEITKMVHELLALARDGHEKMPLPETSEQPVEARPAKTATPKKKK